MTKYGFIGLGLIGGSIARAIKAYENDSYIIAFQRTAVSATDFVSSSLYDAMADETVDEITSNLEDFADCSCVFLCAPVQKNLIYLKLLKDVLNPDCIITDVGSVKGNICSEAKKLGLENQFIGGHPMTGSEKTGYSNSYALLLENAYYILTPLPETDSQKLEKLTSLVKELKSLPIILEPSEHDKITAAISHLPHIIASELVNLVHASDTEGKMKLLAAGGFKDITRIASSSPDVWVSILDSNSAYIRSCIREYIAALEKVHDALGASDSEYIRDRFASAKDYRDNLPVKSSGGALLRVYELFVDIADEAGAIATLATLLSEHQISIKNIGIIHNREYEQGVLRVEFYDAEHQAAAETVLKNSKYTFYKR